MHLHTIKINTKMHDLRVLSSHFIHTLKSVALADGRARVRACVCLIIMLQFLLLLRRHRIHRLSPWEGNTGRSTDPRWKMQNKAARLSFCQSLVISFTLRLLDAGSFFSPVTAFLCLCAASCVGMDGRTYSFGGAGSVRCPRFLWEAANPEVEVRGVRSAEEIGSSSCSGIL